MRGCFSIHDCMYHMIEAATRDQPLSSILQDRGGPLTSRQESSVCACMVAIASCETTV